MDETFEFFLLKILVEPVCCFHEALSFQNILFVYFMWAVGMDRVGQKSFGIGMEKFLVLLDSLALVDLLHFIEIFGLAPVDINRLILRDVEKFFHMKVVRLVIQVQFFGGVL